MSSFSSLLHEDESSTFASAKFPVKLHQLLEAAESDHWLSSIISWARDGNGFLIHNHAVFEKQVLPGVFPAMKGFSSLRRQLNLYGIRKGTPGGKLSEPWNDYQTGKFKLTRRLLFLLLGPYSHQLLRRHRKDLAVKMSRPPAKTIISASAKLLIRSKGNEDAATKSLSSVSKDDSPERHYTVRSSLNAPLLRLQGETPADSLHIPSPNEMPYKLGVQHLNMTSLKDATSQICNSTFPMDLIYLPTQMVKQSSILLDVEDIQQEIINTFLKR